MSESVPLISFTHDLLPSFTDLSGTMGPCLKMNVLNESQGWAKTRVVHCPPPRYP
jgi:hypothetical protein